MVSVEKKNLTIRNIDAEALRLARAACALEGVPMGAWISKAIMARVRKERSELLG